MIGIPTGPVTPEISPNTKIQIRLQPLDLQYLQPPTNTTKCEPASYNSDRRPSQVQSTIVTPKSDYSQHQLFGSESLKTEHLAPKCDLAKLRSTLESITKRLLHSKTIYKPSPTLRSYLAQR